jgi:hypothetical protein
MKLPPAVAQTIPAPDAGVAPPAPAASHTIVAQGEGQ